MYQDVYVNPKKIANGGLMHQPSAPSQRCKLALADGTVVSGIAIGARGEAGGELCFNTSMTGYQEIMTDPSYHGQLVVMTAPQIGNYGVNEQDPESGRPWVRGFLAREFSRTPSA